VQFSDEMRQCLRVTIYLRDIADFAAMNVVWEAWLAVMQAGVPARTTVAAALAREACIWQ
jgi:enamine deaminase RidA (YjgF/YER057c/UK114 family)